MAVKIRRAVNHVVDHDQDYCIFDLARSDQVLNFEQEQR